jgi:predicted DNA-binding antitoxin AbrB/MazE fold protein
MLHGLQAEVRLLEGVVGMTITIDAVYEKGVLKPKKPLLLAEGAEVRLTVRALKEQKDPLESVIGIGKSGRTDGADQHDHYIYGTPKRQ